MIARQTPWSQRAVEADGTRAGADHPAGHMILEILSDAREVAHDRDPHRLQVIRRTDARQHEQLWRVDRSATEQDTAPGSGFMESTVLQVGHADDLVPLDQELGDARVGERGEIASAVSRLQVGVGGAVASPILLRDLKESDTLLRSAIEIVIARVAHSNRRLDKCARERIDVAQVRHVEWSIHAVVVRRRPARNARAS